MDGLDSAPACPSGGTLDRHRYLTEVLRSIGFRAEDVFALSYSGVITDCNGRLELGVPDSGNDLPLYDRATSCTVGAKAASLYLGNVVGSLLAREASTQIVLVGFSFGGVVATHYISQLPIPFVEANIHRVVTIDSPFLGHPNIPTPFGWWKPCGGNSKSYWDVIAGSEVVKQNTTIQDARVTSRFVSANGTNIGDTYPGGTNLRTECGGTFIFIPLAHGCTFTDRVTAKAIREAVASVLPKFGLG